MTTVELLLLVIGLPVALILCMWGLVWLVGDTVRYNQRKQWRLMKNRKVEHYLKTGDKQMLKDIKAIEKRMEEEEV